MAESFSRPNPPNTKREHSRAARPYLLTYKRADWKPRTAPRYRRFESADDARAFVARLQDLARFGPVLARLEIREAGRWREIPIVEVAK